eukprot:6514005-Pyramimonas_sp.AAC.1
MWGVLSSLFDFESDDCAPCSLGTGLTLHASPRALQMRLSSQAALTAPIVSFGIAAVTSARAPWTLGCGIFSGCRASVFPAQHRAPRAKFDCEEVGGGRR